MPPDERLIRRFAIEVWPNGITEEAMADELVRIADWLRSGFTSGEVYLGDNRGWWSTSVDPETPAQP
jgi:hypothetical protein